MSSYDEQGIYGVGVYGTAIYGTTIFDNLVEDGVARLLEQYKEQPNLAKGIRIYLTPLVKIRLVLLAIMFLRRLDSATGIWLDFIGELLSFPRPIGWGDEDYRPALRTWQLANRACGTPPLLIQIALRLRQEGQTARVRYVPHHPKAWDLHIPLYDAALGVIPPAIEDVIRTIVVQATDDGTNGQAVLYDADAYFGFDEDPEASAYDVGVISKGIGAAVPTE